MDNKNKHAQSAGDDDNVQNRFSILNNGAMSSMRLIAEVDVAPGDTNHGWVVSNAKRMENDNYKDCTTAVVNM